MKREYSIYLDLCRFLAALAVVLSHIKQYQFLSPEISQYLPSAGRDAVIIFFVLSGFVIAYTTDRKQPTISEYLTDRATRIYSCALPILLLVVTIDLIGIQHNKEAYSGLYQYEKLHLYIPFHLLFLGEIWTLSEQPFTIPPYWSLGYEVWYYILYIPIFFLRGRKRIFTLILLLVFVGYKLWLLFPLWLAGVLLYKNRSRWLLSNVQSKLLFWLPVLTYFIFKALELDNVLVKIGNEIWPFNENFPLGSAAKYLSDYFVGILTLIHLYAAQFYKLPFKHYLSQVITKLAAYTFTLYLVHAPIIKTVEYHINYNKNSWLNLLGILLLIGVITFFIGFITEHQRHRLKPLFAKAVNTLTNVTILFSPKQNH
ncbi:acyltransferase [Endozoicomonas sp. SM1973]|uniref:Acyltransferase n=1 Tax=Spartinivicinus marinus TaxID=2994442 RepID=A0A853HWD7_9GAMM|nr:acyltransferase [Spartinivicinus marinus]MCX4030037.1 acyltransferase [Spartinivicinus marinus]NYZ64719.1 acyltransferase [Spartinivicinus marinus]